MRRSDGDGFATADVSVSLLDDDRVRKLARSVEEPRVETAIVVYLAVLLASWREGRRVAAEDAVPLWLPLERLLDADEDLRSVGLLDRRSKIPARAWSKWYDPVEARRDRNRERWARYNASRTGGAAELPRGNGAATPPSVPFRSDPAVPSSPSRGSAKRTRSKTDDERTTTGGPVSLADAMAATPFGAELLRLRGDR